MFFLRHSVYLFVTRACVLTFTSCYLYIRFSISKCLLRRILVLRRAGVQHYLVLKIIHRQISFIGHVLRKGQLGEAALTGRIEGKRARGRQRGTLLGWLERATGFRPLDLIKMMRERRAEEAATAAYARVLARHTD